MTASVLSPQIADVLATNLEAVFASLCDQRYGGRIFLERDEEAERDPSTVRFRLRRADLPELRAHFAVRHVGGNVYDVQGRVEDGPVRTFTYSLPETAPPIVPRAPSLARAVASFLLDALEHRIGSDLLRSELRSRVPQPPDRSPSRSPASDRP
jgi:hypothetical protein